MGRFPFDNTYARLPERFFARITPTPVAAPQLIRVSTDLANRLGVDADWLMSDEGVQVLAGNQVADGSEPIAAAYAGHQFANFVPQLGDGRAILIGEVVDRDGIRRDIQLKGSGRTPFSRGGDGRSPLGPVIREYVVSEAMAALGIPTTRALAAVTSGETVYRDTREPGGVFTRIASSHVRVGTFQFFAARGDTEGIRQLADYVIARHYPNAAQAERPYRALLDAVIRAQAELIAKWMLIGFIHGVMNTDNVSISGETIDYGPCAFMDEYHPETVFSSIDRQGRYAYSRQPVIGKWNVTRFAECLLPLLADETGAAIADAEAALEAYAPIYENAFETGLRQKLGLFSAKPGDVELGRDLFETMSANGADFTLTFRRLSEAAEHGADDARLRDLFVKPAEFDQWANRWRQRLSEESIDPATRRESMLAVNPAVIPRNHLVEAAIRAGVDKNDFTPFHELVDVLAKPFENRPLHERYAKPPAESERVHRTFCGT